ncbi:LAMI_0G15038g1_1 [Lachancea mirantina]|uniref:Phosphoglycerate mutase n=1 Tax=Lachancea mirantina TaxID=1230905 RepID=A0A1G4KCA7_9SACH|nr:LAMI_0G15038g1_1 [Lachancea mirantina]
MTVNDTYKIFILRHGQSELNHENIFCGWIDATLTEEGKIQARNAATLIKKFCHTKESLPKIAFGSRLIRTHQTLEVMLDELGLKGDYEIVTKSTNLNDILEAHKEGKIPVLQSWRLNERHYGSWQGQRKPDVLKEYGKEQYMFIRRDYWGKPPPADLEREMIQEKHDKGALTGYDFKEPTRHIKYALEEKSGETLPNSESLSDVVRRLNVFLDQIIVGSLDKCSSSLVVAHGSTVRSMLKILEGISDDDIKDINIPNAIPIVVELDKATKKFVRRYYLDPELAEQNAERVRNEGFENQSQDRN